MKLHSITEPLTFFKVSMVLLGLSLVMAVLLPLYFGMHGFGWVFPTMMSATAIQFMINRQDQNNPARLTWKVLFGLIVRTDKTLDEMGEKQQTYDEKLERERIAALPIPDNVVELATDIRGGKKRK